MCYLRIKDGFVKYPSNWILLNEEDACNCCYMGVIEFHACGLDLPHFLFPAPKPIGELSAEEDAELYRQCCALYPELDQQVLHLIQDSEGHILNAQDVEESYHINFFILYRLGDPYFPADYQPPCGAMIIPD